jgi:hypothetical protein
VTKLKSGRDYWYRVHITDASGKGERVGPARSFKTAPSVEQRRNVRFAVITGQGYATRDNDRGHVAYHGIDKLGIDFIALTGDTVYYDGPAGGIPKSLWPPGVESKGEVLSVKHGARGNYWPDQDVSGLVDVLHDLDLNRTGGFLCVDVDIADESRRPTIDFTFYDPDGNKLDGWLFSNKAKARERDSP